MRDTPAPDELVHHQRFLRGLARSLVADEERAEDLVQESLLAALTHPPRSAESLRAFLASVVRHLASNLRRGEARRTERESGVARAAAVPSTHELQERLELERAVVEAVLALPDAQQRAVYLRWYEELPPREIARQLELPLETVRSHLKRGRARLRSTLDERYGERPAWVLLLARVGRRAAPASGALPLALLATVALVTSLALALAAPRRAPAPVPSGIEARVARAELSALGERAPSRHSPARAWRPAPAACSARAMATASCGSSSPTTPAPCTSRATAGAWSRASERPTPDSLPGSGWHEQRAGASGSSPIRLSLGPRACHPARACARRAPLLRTVTSRAPTAPCHPQGARDGRRGTGPRGTPETRKPENPRKDPLAMQSLQPRASHLTPLVAIGCLLAACRGNADRPSTPGGMETSSAFIVDESQFDGAHPWTEREFLNDPEEFQFVIIGDRTGGANAEGTFALAMDQINLLRPEFVINVGDVIEGYADAPEEFGVMWDEVEGFVGKLAMPFFFTTGNHDVQGEASKQVWLERHGASYYAFVYRDTLFMVLDSEDGSRPEPPEEIKEDLQTYQRLQTEDPEAAMAMLEEFMKSEAVIAALAQPVAFPPAQMKWIEETLAAHPDVRWTFLFMHEPCWENPSDTFLEIEELLADRDYTFFAGHLHYYDYDERNGREYITMGPAGASFHHDGPGNVDHLAWVTMTREGPEIGNIALKGLFDRKGLDPEMFGAYDRKGWEEPETP